MTSWYPESERILNDLFFKKEIFNFLNKSVRAKKMFLTAGSSQPKKDAPCRGAGSSVQISWIIQAFLRGFFIFTEIVRSHSTGICSRQSLASWHRTPNSLAVCTIGVEGWSDVQKTERGLVKHLCWANTLIGRELVVTSTSRSNLEHWCPR